MKGSFQKVADQILEGWRRDCGDLRSLIEGYVITVPPTVVDKLLQAENKALLEQLQTTPHMEKCAKAAALLGQWRGLLKKIGADGNGFAFSPPEFTGWGNAVTQAMETVEWCQTVHDMSFYGSFLPIPYL